MAEGIKRRTYGHACEIARALDVVGERWTLLLVRELFTGTRTYGQLPRALPGIGTNLLADRLKQLEADGLVEKIPLPGGPGRSTYQLTAFGLKLEPVLVELVRFGSNLGTPDGHGEFYRPTWAVLASKAAFRHEIAAGLTERYEFRVDDDVFYLGVRDGRPDNGTGHAQNPVVVAEMTGETFANVRHGRITMSQGVWTGDIRIVEGFAAALDRCEQIFGGRTDPLHGHEQAAGYSR